MKYFFLLPFASLLFSTAQAERVLDTEDAERTEVRYSMIGPRNTLLFYTFEDQGAVLRLSIENKDTSFPIKGQIYLFDPATTAEDLARWINNQHSDGLFREVPKPVEVIQLPEKACSATKIGIKGETVTSPMGGTFADYTVKIEVKSNRVADKFNLKAFEDQSGVFVKISKNSD